MLQLTHGSINEKINIDEPENVYRPPLSKGIGTVVPFAISVLTCAPSIFLQAAWLDGECLLAAFNIAITTLPKSICTGKAAEIIMKGGINVIKSVGSYLTVGNEKRGKAKVPSEWGH